MGIFFLSPPAVSFPSLFYIVLFIFYLLFQFTTPISMAPLVLKIKGSKSFLSFVDLDSEEELSKTWQVCTKVKDSLENGSRLENLSWRLWFRQQLSKHQNKTTSSTRTTLSKRTAQQLNRHRSISIPAKGHSSPINNNSKLPASANAEPAIPVAASEALPSPSVTSPTHQDSLMPSQTISVLSSTQHSRSDSSSTSSQPPANNDSLSTTGPPADRMDIDVTPPLAMNSETNNMYGLDQSFYNFTLPRFTSDQAMDQSIELENIFGAMDSGNLFFTEPTNTNTTNDSSTHQQTALPLDPLSSALYHTPSSPIKATQLTHPKMEVVDNSLPNSPKTINDQHNAMYMSATNLPANDTSLALHQRLMNIASSSSSSSPSSDNHNSNTTTNGYVGNGINMSTPPAAYMMDYSNL